MGVPREEIIAAWQMFEDIEPDISTERLWAMVMDHTGCEHEEVTAALAAMPGVEIVEQEPEPPVGENQYRCAACGGVFGKGRTDEEARAELMDDFPGYGVEDCALVCDDCHREMGLGEQDA